MNAVWFPAMLDDTEQRELLRDCFAKLVPVAHAGVGGPTGTPPDQLLSYNTGWVPDKPGTRMPCCVELAGNYYKKFRAQYAGAIAEAARRHRDLCLPDALATDSLWARMYASDHSLGFHQDPPPCGWVLLINLGAAARFAFYHPSAEDRVVRQTLRSGDALFNGPAQCA